MHAICFPGFLPGFFLFHGFFGLLVFALIVGLIVKHLFGDSGAGGFHTHPGGAEPGGAGPGAFCGQCGVQFRDSTPFCPHCGARRG